MIHVSELSFHLTQLYLFFAVLLQLWRLSHFPRNSMFSYVSVYICLSLFQYSLELSQTAKVYDAFMKKFPIYSRIFLGVLCTYPYEIEIELEVSKYHYCLPKNISTTPRSATVCYTRLPITAADEGKHEWVMMRK